MYLNFIISVIALIIGSIFYLTLGIVLIALIFSGYLVYAVVWYIVFTLTYMLMHKFLKRRIRAFAGTILLYIGLFSLYTYDVYHTPPTTSSLFENAKFACRFANKFQIEYPYDLNPCLYRLLARDYRNFLKFEHKEQLTKEEKKIIWDNMIQKYKSVKGR